MTLREFPPVPAFPCLRLCTLQDIPRAAHVARRGFQDSEIYRFERPYANEYPDDVEAFFRNLLRDQISDSNSVVIVAEDVKSPKEDELMLQRGVADPQGTMSRVVVGVCSWVFEHGSKRKGQFKYPYTDPKEPIRNRDLLPERMHQIDAIKEEGEKKYFDGMRICDKLVVHPAYWRRGHGSALLSWGQHISKVDGVSQGVMPSHAGEKIFFSLGYKQIGTLHVKGDDNAEGFHIAVATYSPPAKTA